MSHRKHLLVGNPTAQSGKNAERIAVARELLDRAGLAYEFLATLPRGGTVAAVAEALRNDTTLSDAIYMGGDGTFAEVAKGILASGRAEQVRLAMLPTGTANDQGKSFGLESAEDALEANVAVIAKGAETRLDAGYLRGFGADGSIVVEDFFFDSAGWGISPRVLAERNDDRELIEKIPVVRAFLRDQLVYAGALLRTFAESYVEDDKFDVVVTTELGRHEWRDLSDLIVKGTRVYGGLWVFDPEARPDDGKFEVVPFAGKRDWLSKAIVHLDETGIVQESLESLGVEHSPSLSAARIDLAFHPHEGALPIVAQLDGEESVHAPRVSIEVRKRALRIVVPASYATP